MIESSIPELVLQLEEKPFAVGRYSYIYRAKYKGREVVVKRFMGNTDELKEQFLNEAYLLRFWILNDYNLSLLLTGL